MRSQNGETNFYALIITRYWKIIGESIQGGKPF